MSRIQREKKDVERNTCPKQKPLDKLARLLKAIVKMFITKTICLHVSDKCSRNANDVGSSAKRGGGAEGGKVEYNSSYWPAAGPCMCPSMCLKPVSVLIEKER